MEQAANIDLLGENVTAVEEHTEILLYSGTRGII
jgi:hypothetical protein